MSVEDMRRLALLVENAGSVDMETLRMVRNFLEPLWGAWKTSRRSGWENRERVALGMCRFTAAFLKPILDEMTGHKWSVVAGFADFHLLDPGWDKKNGRPATAFAAEDGVGGMIDKNGKWHDHYWLTDGATIIDLTADQFGWEPVIVTPVTDDRYLVNWKPSMVKQHLKDVSQRAAEWREKWENAR